MSVQVGLDLNGAVICRQYCEERFEEAFEMPRVHI